MTTVSEHNYIAFPFGVGIEYSCLGPNYKERKGTPTKKYRDELVLISMAMETELRKTSDCHCFIDCHCIEIVSPVFHTYDEWFNFDTFIRKLFRKFKCTTQQPDITVCGGGHIHFDNYKPASLRKLFTEYYKRPWIPWIFTHPDDTDSCSSITPYLRHYSDLAAYSTQMHMPAERFFWFGETGTDNCNVPSNDKIFGLTLNNNSKTVEFRCVESARNQKEQWLQLQFFLAFYQHFTRSAWHNGCWYPEDNRTLKELQQITPEACIDGFKKLLNTLELNYDDYLPFIRRNLKPRWKLGRKRV